MENLLILHFILISSKFTANIGNCEEQLTSTDCRPTVGQLANQSVDCWTTVGRLSADCWPTVGRQFFP